MYGKLITYNCEILRTDVTAVKIFNQYILAGIGSKVYIYKLKNSYSCIEIVHALHGQKIYGFVLSECGTKVLVFGGKQFTIVSISLKAEGDCGHKFVKTFEPIVCDDWLHGAVWTGEEVALLTAHNVVQKWNVNTKSVLTTYLCMDNSILYSGLLLPLKTDVLVMAGTVFSEVIIHCLSDEEPLHRLRGHKGVIFSISCHPDKNLIVTTSDDRSVRVWGPKESQQCSINNLEFWKNINIECKYVLYGHTARVMRSCISDSTIISVGEDSAICHWDFHGNLLKKTVAHQNGEVWTVDTNNEFVLSGGADSSIVWHPIITSNDYCDNKTIHFEMGTPKKLKITKRKNLVILNETDLVYFDTENDIHIKYELKHETTYKMLDIDQSKDVVAVADMKGKLDLFKEETIDNAVKLVKILDTKIDIGKILSMHFIKDKCLIFCSESGYINVICIKNNIIEVSSTFVLPPCKERWVTAAANSMDIFVLGDRCGNIHICNKGQMHPVKSFSKVHGRYGPTSISIVCGEIITTGRDGTIKYFKLSKNHTVKYMYCKDLGFEWIDKILWPNSKLACGFRERLFIICDLHSNTNIVEIPCGGGHRSWDINSYSENNEEYVQFVYIKNLDIVTATVHKTRIRPIRIIEGWHSKEVNCLKCVRNDNSDSVCYISGSEDTTLRITESSKTNAFEEKLVFKHLSSVKAIEVYKLENGNFLILSAGGRAQICIKTIDISRYPNIKAYEEVNYMIKGTDKERKGNRSWRECTTDFDPETRVMDIGLIKDQELDGFIIIAGCSDGVLRVFTYSYNEYQSEKSEEFKFFKEIKYHNTCILKTKCVKFNNYDVLAVCTTRGEVTFWDISQLKSANIEPILTLKTNQSGINCFSFTVISDDQFLIATGGDDNAVYLSLLEIGEQNNLSSLKVVQHWASSQYHSSQITGLSFVDKYMVSTSIDQRVTLFEWEVSECCINCEFLSQHWTDIPDVHGLDLINFSGDTIVICVYGKGVEVLSLPVK